MAGSFDQARSEEGLYSVTTKEIWVEGCRQPPCIITCREQPYRFQETDVQYADLIFEVTNEGFEDMDVSRTSHPHHRQPHHRL